MDEAGIETTEPIFKLATKCERLFSEHISRLKNGSDLNGAKVVGEYQQKFSAWAAFLGVFAVPDMCLDRRLRNHTEVQDLVLRLLDIMRRNLVHLLEIDHSKSTLDEDIDSPDLNQVSSSPICVNLESLRGIEGAVDRLNHLGRTIQRSSEAGQATKVGRFVTTFDSTSFEEIARSAVKSFYPGASASLLEQLAQAMTNMYERFHYRRSRQVRLQARPKAALSAIGEEPASNSKADTGRASFQSTAPPVMNVDEQLPRLVSMKHLEDRSHKSRESKPTSLDSREFNKLFSQQRNGSAGSKTRSILVSQVAYPQPSKESLVCEWCFTTLSKDELKGEKWKKHLNEDFKPFICISEKCKGQVNQFATSRAWFSHMLETHGQNWHREIHLPVWWICPLCNSAETTFSRAQELSEHISKLHDDIFTRPQIQVIVNQSQLRSPRPQDICPLCCLSMRDEQEDEERQHLHLARPSLLLKDQMPGESHKRVKTETGSSQQIQHSDVNSEGEMEEMVSNTGAQSAQNTQRVNIEAIARHVAAHLQGMMLFTLRMMSLDVPNATEDEKSLSSSTDHDASRIGLGQQHSEQETGTVISISEEDINMDVDGPSIEHTIPDSEHIIDWKDVINDTQHFSGTDSFLQEVIRSGAFHYDESTGAATYESATKEKRENLYIMNTINRPIFKEISKIQRGIGLPPSARESHYHKCQAITVYSEPCKRILGKNRDEVFNLLSEFRRVTEYSEIDNLYDKMARFIALTHCYSHQDRALEAFSKWKRERIATTSSSSSTPATNAFFPSDSLDVSSETSSVASPTLSSGLGRNPSASDLYVEETIRSLTATRRRDDNFDNTQELRDRMRSLGNVVFPSEDAQQNTLKIYRTIKYPPHPLRMSYGIIYIYKHTSIPGIFKIGSSAKFAQRRHRQPGNCHGIDTTIIYRTENPFTGAFQAERIIHAALRHKQIQIYECSNCGRGHQEWFLISREEAFKIVKSAESWLKMPAYTIHQGRYELSPRAEVIYGSMFSFSLAELNQNINNIDAPDDTSDVFSVNHLVAGTQQINISTSSSPVAGDGHSTEPTGRSSASELRILLNEQISTLRRAASVLDEMSADEIRELTQRRPLRPTNVDGDEECSDAEESQESDSDEDYSEVDEAEELDIDEKYTKVEKYQEVGIDEEHSETEEPQESHTDEEYHQGEAFGALTRSEPVEATPEVNIELVRLLRAIRQGGAREFRIIFPS